MRAHFDEHRTLDFWHRLYRPVLGADLGKRRQTCATGVYIALPLEELNDCRLKAGRLGLRLKVA